MADTLEPRLADPGIGRERESFPSKSLCGREVAGGIAKLSIGGRKMHRLGIVPLGFDSETSYVASDLTFRRGRRPRRAVKREPHCEPKSISAAMIGLVSALDKAGRVRLMLQGGTAVALVPAFRPVIRRNRRRAASIPIQAGDARTRRIIGDTFAWKLSSVSV